MNSTLKSMAFCFFGMSLLASNAHAADMALSGGVTISAHSLSLTSVTTNYVAPGSVFEQAGLSTSTSSYSGYQPYVFDWTSNLATFNLLTFPGFFNARTVTISASFVPGNTYILDFQNTAFGSLAIFSVAGSVTASSPSGSAIRPTPYTGTFSMTFDGMSTADVMTAFASGKSLQTTYSGSFLAPLLPIPEPSTALMNSAGLLLLALVWRGGQRAKARNDKAKEFESSGS